MIASRTMLYRESDTPHGLDTGPATIAAGAGSERAYRFISLLWFIGVAGILLLPVWLWQLPWGDDTISHYNWTRSLLDQWLEAPGYSRWLTSYNDGLGSPDFFFYPPLSTYVAVWFGALAPEADPSTAIKFASLLALGLSGWAAYLFLSDHVDRRAAGIAATLYMLLPYHLGIDFYWRTAIAEFWSFVWMPLILMGIGRMIGRDSRFAWVGVALAYAMLIFTHMPTTLFFTVFIPIVVLGMARNGTRLRSLFRVASAMALGVGLAGFYLVPALSMQQFTEMALLWRKPIASLLLALPPSFPGLEKSGWLMNLSARLYFVALSTALVALVVYGLALLRQPSPQARRFAHLWIGITLFALFLTLGPSSVVWENLPLLHKVQFPWRILSVVTLGTVVLIALWLQRWHRCGPVPADAAGFALLSMLLVAWLGDVAWLSYQRTHYVPRAFSAASDSRLNNCEFMPIWAGDGGADYDPGLVCDGKRRSDGRSVSAPTMPVVSAGQGTISGFSKAGSGIEVEVVAQDRITLQLPLLYFPIWEARDTTSGSLLPLRPSQPGGFVQVEVPGGVNRVHVGRVFHSTEVLGMALSLAAVALLVGVAVWPRRRIRSTS